jgi:hypothetical protein
LLDADELNGVGEDGREGVDIRAEEDSTTYALIGGRKCKHMHALCVIRRMVYLVAVNANSNLVADMTVFLATVLREEKWRIVSTCFPSLEDACRKRRKKNMLRP